MAYPFRQTTPPFKRRDTTLSNSSTGSNVALCSVFFRGELQEYPTISKKRQNNKTKLHSYQSNSNSSIKHYKLFIIIIYHGSSSSQKLLTYSSSGTPRGTSVLEVIIYIYISFSIFGSLILPISSKTKRIRLVPVGCKTLHLYLLSNEPGLGASQIHTYDEL